MTTRVYVWDLFIRVFHWSLVGLFTTSYLTGESESQIHIYSGYAVGLLLLLRVLWGLFGSKRARFSDFIYSPKKIIAYTKGLLNGNPPHFLGHNPLGGLMVVALIVSLSLTVFSGLKLYAEEEGKGPLAWAPLAELSVPAVPTPIASAVADEDEDEYEHKGEHHEESEEFWEEIHETAVNFMLLLIALHVLGVVVSSRLYKESLIKSMITGYKDQPEK